MAPAVARAALESLLRERRLDTTLTSAVPEYTDAERLAPSGLTSLDGQLAGGLPRGQVSEITGPRSSGRTSVLLSLMAAATRRGEVVALIDTLDRFDAPSAEAAGVVLSHVLWVRGHDVPLSSRCLAPDWEPSRARAGRGRASLVDRAVNRAIKAASLAVHAGGFGLVAIDLADVPAAVVRALPFTTWLRLQRALEGGDTAGVIVADEPTARSAGGVSIRLASPRTAEMPVPDVPAVPPAEAPDGTPLFLRGRRTARSSDPSFHRAVMASRRPFVAPSPRHAVPAGRWVGNGGQRFRFRGLSAQAAVVRAQRRPQSTASIRLDFGE